MDFFEILKAALFGIVQGITEWLPISSTGHMILLNEFINLDTSPEFWKMFLTVIQFASILAVIILYWKTLFPFKLTREAFHHKEVVKPGSISMWLKIIVACVPAAIVGLLWEEEIDALFYNAWSVAAMLILVGILFIIVENRNRKRVPMTIAISQITYPMAFLIGLFQLVAAVFPGTSRSGATIIGGLLLGMSRTTAAEFTFFLAVPVMFGASLLEMLKFGFAFTGMEIAILLTGMAVAFIVSIIVIRFLMGYIKKHDFKPFGWYRIVLGVLVLLYFIFAH